MADSSKKSGGRDISDLKARLGLKKQQAAPAPARGNGAQSGGVVPPPGISLPPPPGLQPQQPAIPNAADDPFGAMNAMAAHGTVQRAPEIVIVNDGKPVENVGAESSAASLLKLAVPAAIALIVGIAVGKIGTGASFYNDGLKGAKGLLGDKSSAGTVAFLKKTLSDIDTALDAAKTKNGLKPDLAVDKQLKDLAAKLDVKPANHVYALAAAAARNVDAETADQILGFYAGVAEVKDMIDQHNKSAAGDDIALKKAKDAGDAAASEIQGMIPGSVKYGVLLSAPTESDKADFGAKVVEIAGVYCGGSKNPVAKCPEGEAPSGWAYRNDPGATPIAGDLVQQGADTLPAKKVVPLLPNGVRDALLKGNDASVSEFFYTKRLKALYERIHGKAGPDGKPTGGLLDDGNKLETKLQTEAARGSRFSFFM